MAAAPPRLGDDENEATGRGGVDLQAVPLRDHPLTGWPGREQRPRPGGGSGRPQAVRRARRACSSVRRACGRAAGAVPRRWSLRSRCPLGIGAHRDASFRVAPGPLIPPHGGQPAGLTCCASPYAARGLLRRECRSAAAIRGARAAGPETAWEEEGCAAGVLEDDHLAVDEGTGAGLPDRCRSWTTTPRAGPFTGPVIRGGYAASCSHSWASTTGLRVVEGLPVPTGGSRAVRRRPSAPEGPFVGSPQGTRRAGAPAQRLRRLRGRYPAAPGQPVGEPSAGAL